jgi:hypothetical protein
VNRYESAIKTPKKKEKDSILEFDTSKLNVLLRPPKKPHGVQYKENVSWEIYEKEIS